MSFFSFLILEYYFFSSLRFLSDPIVSLSEPSTHSILICITYPIVKLPILYVHWSTTYLHIIWAVFFSPFLAFFFFLLACLLSRCLIDSILYSIDDWPTSPFFFSIFYNFLFSAGIPAFSFFFFLSWTSLTCCHSI